MSPSEARNLMPGDHVDYAVGPDYDSGRVREVCSRNGAVMVVVRSESGYGDERIPAGRILLRTVSALRKPAPSIKACRDMTRGYLP